MGGWYNTKIIDSENAIKAEFYFGFCFCVAIPSNKNESFLASGWSEGPLVAVTE